MRLNRLVAGTVTAGLLGLSPLTLAAPAQATENLTTTTTLEIPFVDPAKPPMYGDKVTIRASVTDSKGASAYKGTVTLYQMTADNPAGTAVATAPASGYVAFPDITATASASFTAVYSGYAATTTYENNYAASQSTAAPLTVTRKVHLTNPKGTLIKMKITPDYGNEKVRVHKKVGSRWKSYKSFKTNKNGRVQFTLPAPHKGKWQWQITVKGSTTLAPWQFVGTTYRR